MISLIMPAYNAENYISIAINSVLKQTNNNWQLVIVDDGSTDNTSRIVKDIAQKDERIIFIRQEHKGTASAARNTALKYTTGEYVQMLDADDWLASDFLEKMYLKLQEQDFDILIPNLQWVTNEGKVLRELGPIKNNYNTIINGEEAFYQSLCWNIHGVFCIKSKILKLIGYDENHMNGDEVTTRKLYYNSNKITFVNSTYFYRNNENSTTRSKANIVRTFYTLYNSFRIYDFAEDNKMSTRVLRLASKKLLNDLIIKIDEYNYLVKTNQLDNNQILESYNIIIDTINKLTLKIILMSHDRRCFVFLFRKNTKLLFKLCSLFIKIEKTLKGILHAK